jgi:2-polyprenyl-3-methyl-5-hydroxy-6-metoxy-1,4-benzoquinol methylase
VRCGFVFANPRPTEASLVVIYAEKEIESSIALYERIATERTLATYDERLFKIERLLGAKGRLLDFGCAAAYFTQRAQVLGWDAYGIDMGNWIEDAASRRGVRNVRSCQLADANFEKNFFDVIHVAQVFEHLINPTDLLFKLVELLKPGGLLYIDVPNYSTIPIVLGRDDFFLNMPPQHINYFSPKTLRTLLSAASLNIFEIGANDGLKLENVFGRKISSEIAAAYTTSSPSKIAVDFARTTPYRLPDKGFIKSFLSPLLYSRLRLGMNLYSYCFKR